MTTNHMICPACGHDFYTDSSYATCAACSAFFYASQSRTCRLSPEANAHPPSDVQQVIAAQEPEQA